jgi:hypothetical protein
VSFATVTLCVASQLVFIFVVYFVIDSVQKFLDTPSYNVFFTSILSVGYSILHLILAVPKMSSCNCYMKKQTHPLALGIFFL